MASMHGIKEISAQLDFGDTNFLAALAEGVSTQTPLKFPGLLKPPHDFVEILRQNGSWAIRSFVSAKGDYFLDGSDDDRAILTTSMSFETTMFEHLDM